MTEVVRFPSVIIRAVRKKIMRKKGTRDEGLLLIEFPMNVYMFASVITVNRLPA